MALGGRALASYRFRAMDHFPARRFALPESFFWPGHGPSLWFTSTLFAFDHSVLFLTSLSRFRFLAAPGPFAACLPHSGEHATDIEVPYERDGKKYNGNRHYQRQYEFPVHGLHLLPHTPCSYGMPCLFPARLFRKGGGKSRCTREAEEGSFCDAHEDPLASEG
jgi:hypothetical protein